MFESQKFSAGTRRPHIPESVNKDYADLPLRCQTLHRTAHSSLDILEHQPGEFHWRTKGDLTAWVLSGSAEVDLDDGRAISLRPGQAVFLPRGLRGHWVVTKSLKTAVVWND